MIKFLLTAFAFYVFYHALLKLDEYFNNPDRYDFMEYRPKKEERNGEEDDL